MSAVDANANTVLFQLVRLKGATDGLRARQRCETALAGLSTASLSLPYRSLLIVNQLAPTVRLQLGHFGSHQAFGQAVQQALERNACNAKRPWLNPDAANANAVLFSDESELMACLLRDWLQGSFGNRWWWQVVLEGLTVSTWWRSQLLPRGDVLPAVLAHLASQAQAQAAAWVVCLSDAEAILSLKAIAQTHAMTGLSDELSGSWSPTASIPVLPVQQNQPLSPAPAVRVSPDAIAAYRHLVSLIPESQAPALTIAQRRLLAIGLGLQRASAWTRSPAFVLALQALPVSIANLEEPAVTVNGSSADKDLNSINTDEPESPKHQQSAEPANPLPLLSTRLKDNSPKSMDSAILVTPTQSPPLFSNLSELPKLAIRRVETLSSAQPAAIQPISNSDFEPTQSVEDQLITDCAEQTESAAQLEPASIDFEPAFMQSIESQFAGIFYLLNVALSLGLYGDFTQPRHPGIALSPWDWLALIGRSWLGKSFEQDPVWRLLAELAGRSVTQEPAGDFVAPDLLTVPDDWLKPWVKAHSLQSANVMHLKVSETRKRLQIWHDAGFMVMDMPRIPNLPPLTQASQACAKSTILSAATLVRIERQPHSFKPSISLAPALNRWLQWTLLYLNARLIRALSDDSTHSVAHRVCCHAAKIYFTSTALDVHFSLATLPIELRIAGLDRDPGWIPSAGRSISFHFA
jgi:hypothetical protein